MYFFTSFPYFRLLYQIILQTVEILPCRLPADIMGKNLPFEIFYATPCVIVDANFDDQCSFRHVRLN